MYCECSFARSVCVMFVLFGSRRKSSFVCWSNKSVSGSAEIGDKNTFH